MDGWLVNGLVGGCVGWFGLLVGGLVGWLVGWDWLVGCWVGCISTVLFIFQLFVEAGDCKKVTASKLTAEKRNCPTISGQIILFLNG